MTKEKFETLIHEDIPSALFHVSVKDKDEKTGIKMDELILLEILAANPTALLHKDMAWFYQQFIVETEADVDTPYLIEVSIEREYKYNKNYGDDRICACGHPYYRHFDTYEEMEAVGCKYCGCSGFIEETI